MKNILFILCLISLVSTVEAQDPHFSQFYNTPLDLNPAISGMINEDLRLIGNYRNQWNTISAGFLTRSASFDMPLSNYFLGDDIVGIGLQFQNDQAGASQLSNTQVNISAAYNKSLGGESHQYLGFGGRFGIAQQRLKTANLIFDNQYDGGGFDQSLPSRETMLSDQQYYFDFAGGVSWTMTPDRFNSFYAGVSVFHLNEPKVSFLGDQRELLYRRYTAYAGAEIRLNHLISIIPRAVILMQGPAFEANFGGLVRFNMGESNSYRDETSIYIGTMHRTKDAQVMITRFDYGPFGLSFSYDVNISKLNKATYGHGAMELAVLYKPRFDKKSHPSRQTIRCPKF